MCALLLEAAQRAAELEGPQEVVGDLEVLADGENLVDQILNADDAGLGKLLLDDLVVGKGDALTGDLAETTLVDQLADGLEVGVTERGKEERETQESKTRENTRNGRRKRETEMLVSY